MENGTLNEPDIHVEILQSSKSTLQPKNVEYIVQGFLIANNILASDSVLNEFEDAELKKHVTNVSICVDNPHHDFIQKYFIGGGCRINYHVFRLNSDGVGVEQLEEDIPAANHWLLPSKDFHGLWENLIYNNNVKSQLLNFVSTTLLFSDNCVDSNVVLWNRVVLLHGPPGTGKTSLCRALSQKITIRFGHRYRYGQLIEINSHSLFSRWFSESGKLVMKMFKKIHDLIDDPEALVFLLIDEVESLAHTRKASLSGTEPSDAIRVVNALLTEIDDIRRYPNVILLTTSNITEAIDLAFVDRADIKQYIGPPNCAAIYEIYLSCINELQRTGIIFPAQTLVPWKQMSFTSNSEDNSILSYSNKLLEISKKSDGLSGRTLRKLPFLAHALFIQSSKCSLDQFLGALSQAVIKQFKDREDLNL